MEICLSELITRATQCLVELGLSAGTIRDYQCSAFRPLERRLKDQENINPEILLAQEEFFLGSIRTVKYPDIHLTGGYAASVCLQRYAKRGLLHGKSSVRRRSYHCQRCSRLPSAVLSVNKTAARGRRTAGSLSAGDFSDHLKTAALHLLGISVLPGII